jgi:hypothetical protein
MAIDLTDLVGRVLASRDVESKKEAVLELIEASHAKKETKSLFTNKVKYVNMSAHQLDKLAYDYMLSGEGMKVR